MRTIVTPVEIKEGVPETFETFENERELFAQHLLKEGDLQLDDVLFYVLAYLPLK